MALGAERDASLQEETRALGRQYWPSLGSSHVRFQADLIQNNFEGVWLVCLPWPGTGVVDPPDGS